MQMSAMLFFAVLRGSGAALLALFAPFAHAGADALGVPAAPSEWRTASLHRVPDLFGVAPDLSLIRYAQTTPGTVDSDPLAKRGSTALADPINSIAIVYPDIAEPYRSVFTKIIEGIEDGAGGKVRGFAVGANADAAELGAQLKRHQIKVVIALGRQGLKVASALERDITVVVGGVLLLPDAEHKSLSGISLTPDPALLFTRLKSLQPGVKRVHVVYDPQHNEWLIKLAREAAKAQGLELMTHEARSLADAAKRYESLFASADGRRDSVWLPQDPTTVEESTILPLVLKESWNRNVPVFSSSYLHVKKGALFVLYPNNVELGRNLAASALKSVAGESRKGIVPLREVYSAVNLRTANHIGLNISSQVQRSFDSVFPEQ
jgi:putative tryptophan/tyrosine transport system substrate-binding protein